MVQSRQGLWIPQSGRRREPDEDIFVHMETVRHAGIIDLQPGQRLEARIAEGRKGLTAVELRADLIGRAAGLGLMCRAGRLPALGVQRRSQLDRSPAGLEQVPLTIITADRQEHRFIVEVARTPEEQAHGLMYRQSLAPDRGMIFPYEPPRQVEFWMKNTLIPLDMIFVRADGRSPISTPTPCRCRSSRSIRASRWRRCWKSPAGARPNWHQAGRQGQPRWRSTEPRDCLAAAHGRGKGAAPWESSRTPLPGGTVPPGAR